MTNNYCFNEAHRQAIKILFGIDDACGIGLQWQSDGRIIVDIDRTPKSKRYVLPMPSSGNPDEAVVPMFYAYLGDGKHWYQTTESYVLETALRYRGAIVTQADIDAAPDWVKAIKPVEVRDEEA